MVGGRRDSDSGLHKLASDAMRIHFSARPIGALFGVTVTRERRGRAVTSWVFSIIGGKVLRPAAAARGSRLAASRSA